MWDFVALKADIASRMSSARYSHTCGVASVAKMLAERLCPELIDETVAAALLHDIAKELPFDHQVELAKMSNLPIAEEDLDIVPAFHAVSAIAVIKNDYPQYATEAVLAAVRNHCVGDPKMSLIDKIVYVSDFIEPGRKYSESIRIRDFLIDDLDDIDLRKLDEAVLMTAESTVRHLESNGNRVHSKTKAMIENMKIKR